MKESSTVHTLEQVKVMAHPLRMRLLEAFSHKPMTTIQVAALLGERATRLYHHVDALERVGLIDLVRTGKKRGTVEKYYQTVARTFAVDRQLFKLKSRSRVVHNRMLDVITGIFEDTLSDIRDRLAERIGKPGTEEKRIIVSRSRIHVTQEDLVRFDKAIKTLLKGFETKKQTPGAVEYGLTLALYPAGKRIRHSTTKDVKNRRKK